MNPDIQKLEQKIDEQQKMIAEMNQTVERLYKYFKWTLIITIILFVLPLIGLIFIIPSFLSNYLGPINSLTSGM